tara:strand:- start:335 stop:1168 length:834 start_codon:yes stop_codon:yes gene_type:complete
MCDKILDIKNLSFYYSNPNTDNKQKWVKIFDNVNIDTNVGSVIGIAGKSGCGKTTLAKAIVNYFSLSGFRENRDYKIDGKILFYDGHKSYDINSIDYKKISPPPIQMVFQDPRTSLNMKMKLYDQLKESIKIGDKLSKNNIDSRINSIAKDFKILEHLNSTPQDLSGGQRRRFGLAKIISSNPKLIIADEPVASLDVSIKQNIMDTLFSLKNRGISIVVISHDISLLKNNADFIYVMDNGKIVEKWRTSKNPQKEETVKLNNDSDYVNQFIKKVSKS